MNDTDENQIVATPENAEATLTALRLLFPRSVGASLPLKIGVREDISSAIPCLDVEDIASALAILTDSSPYLRNSARSLSKRVALDGTPVAEVEESHRLRAALLLADRAAQFFEAHGIKFDAATTSACPEA